MTMNELEATTGAALTLSNGYEPVPVKLTGAPVAKTLDELTAKLEQLGAGPDLLRSTVAWVGTYDSDATKTAYVKNVGWWITWCVAQGLNPLTAGPVDADRYINALKTAVQTEGPKSRRGKPLSAATVSQRASAASAWLTYLRRAASAGSSVAPNPFEGAKRPKVSKKSVNVGVSTDDMGKLLRWASANMSARDSLLIHFLAGTASRITAAVQVTPGDFGMKEVEPHVWVPGVTLKVKGGEEHTARVPGAVMSMVNAYVKDNGLAPGDFLFGTESRDGKARHLSQSDAYKLIRRAASRSGVAKADRVGPHSLRHAYVTTALGDGKSIKFVADALNHKSVDTTARYDRGSDDLKRSPSDDVFGRYLSRD